MSNAPAKEICFLALTRPSLTFGVPTWGLLINGTGCFVSGMILSGHTWSNSPFMYWLLALPIHMAMRRLTSLDFHWVRTLTLWAMTTGIGSTVLHVVATQHVKAGKGTASSG